MSANDQVASAGGARWRRFRIRLPRPTGIRNGGLLLVLVALAAIMALVDRPPEPGVGGRGSGIFQHLPPPVGITRQPPVVDQPSTPPGDERAGALAGPGERPRSLDRAHPNRQHPRPARSQTSRQRSGDAAGRPTGGGQGGTGTSRPPVGQPPVTTPPGETAPAARVRVPSVPVRVRPPALLGRDLPEVRAETPQVTVATSATEVPRLRLG